MEGRTKVTTAVGLSAAVGQAPAELHSEGSIWKIKRRFWNGPTVAFGWLHWSRLVVAKGLTFTLHHTVRLCEQEKSWKTIDY